jgi:cytochrome c oxidase assembly protein subunit 11
MPSPSAPWTKNRRMAVMLLGVAALFFGFGFALVPLYDVFCELTGLNGKTSAAANVITTQTSGDAHRVVAVVNSRIP